MNFCKKCGKPMGVDDQFCQFCGVKNIGVESEYRNNKFPNKKFSRKNILIIVGILIIIIGAGFWVWQNRKSEISGQNNNSKAQSKKTPEDIGFVIPETDINKRTTLSTGEKMSSEIIFISFKSETSQTIVDEIATSIGGKINGKIPGVGFYIKFNSPKTGQEIEAVIKTLKQNQNIETASPDFFYTVESFLPAETDIEKLNESKKWGFDKIKLPEAWNLIRENKIDLAPVTVAVIDTGIDLSHPDLKGNIILEMNGYQAWDFGDDDNDVSFNTRNFCSGSHGTKVSGIIAATINQKGINGVAPTAKIFPLKYWPQRIENPLECEEAVQKTATVGPGYAVAIAVAYATLAKVDVINLSLGGYIDSKRYQETAEAKIIQKALSSGIVVVAAAGNDKKDFSNHFPSALPGVVAVGAIAKNGDRADFSNFNSGDNKFFVAAPGSGIYTLEARDISVAGVSWFDSYVGGVNGTSIAAPFVSGLAALLKQVDKNLNPERIMSILKDTAEDIKVSYPNDSGKHIWKLVNAEAAVASILQTPSLQPQTFSVSSFFANPASGNAPLNGVSLTATVTGSAQGTINYTFYCNRSDLGTNITSGSDAKFDGVSDNPKTVANICNYSNPGTYTAKVIAEQGSAPPAEARISINIKSSSISPQPSEKIVRIIANNVQLMSSNNLGEVPLGVIIGVAENRQTDPKMWSDVAYLNHGDTAKYISEKSIRGDSNKWPQAIQAVEVELVSGKKGWVVTDWFYKGETIVMAEALSESNLSKPIPPSPPLTDIKGKWSGVWKNDTDTGSFEIQINDQSDRVFTGKGSEVSNGQTQSFTIGGSTFRDKIFFDKYYPNGNAVKYEGTINGNAASGIWKENALFGTSGTWSMTKTN